MFPILDQKGQRHRLRRAHPRQGRAEVPELAGDAAVREGARAVWPAAGAQGHPRSGCRDRRRRATWTWWDWRNSGWKTSWPRWARRRDRMHHQKLFRLTDRVVFCFDRDAAGDKAALARDGSQPGIPGRQRVGYRLPGSQDPDRFIRERAGPSLGRAAGHAADEFLVRQLERQTKPYTARPLARMIPPPSRCCQRVTGASAARPADQGDRRSSPATGGEVGAACELQPLNVRRAAPPRDALRARSGISCWRIAAHRHRSRACDACRLSST